MAVRRAVSWPLLPKVALFGPKMLFFGPKSIRKKVTIMTGHLRGGRAAGIVAALQPGEEMKRKWRENEEIDRKWRENEEMERK